MKMAVIVVVLHPLTVVTWNYLPFQINGDHLVIVVVPMKVYNYSGNMICPRSSIFSVSPEAYQRRICQNEKSANNYFHPNNH
jgi:hypothetical protein